MKLVAKACNQWLPEFGTDHECREGRVIDIDTYTDQGFTDICYPPCPICNAAEFEAHLAELRANGGATFQASLAAIYLSGMDAGIYGVRQQPPVNIEGQQS